MLEPCSPELAGSPPHILSGPFGKSPPPPVCRILTSFFMFEVTTLILGLHLWRVVWEWVCIQSCSASPCVAWGDCSARQRVDCRLVLRVGVLVTAG